MDRRPLWLAALALAVVVQLVVLYLPSPPEGPGIPGLDKVVHVGVFAAPALAGVLGGLRPAVLGAALAAHAVVSELAQHALLAERSGDAWDVAADLVGVALGLAVGVALRRRAARPIERHERR
ncbi:VanZ family protein [Agrococcus terreus]|uniref:VanZ like family protein n=1 Tax=Agrococcus terreus TaxID=574649 RepID=A0ABQ2KBC1_9MICO|nr:VanZ family protein [Agrococcus terreus]GGN78139.1 hypothetical protein GCM10010968_03600 [Agrococcus terreus]